MPEITGWTPGPWDVQWRGDFRPLVVAESAGHDDIAEVCWIEPQTESGGDASLVNATLIAMAPALYEAAVRAREVRRAMKAYYAEKDQGPHKRELLIASKVAEKALDEALRALFGDAP